MGHAWSRPRRALAAGLLTAAPTGSFYGFSVYSEALKQQFDLTQGQLANINTIPYVLGFAGPAAGWVVHTCGPSVATMIGGVVQTTGQVLMYLVGTRRMVVSNPPLTLVLFAMINFSGMAMNSAAGYTNPVHHYPRQRGKVTAMVKSFVGLSGAVVTQAFVLLFGTPTADPTAMNALLMWASTTSSCCALAAALVPRRASAADVEPVDILHTTFALIIFLGIFSTLVSLLPVHTRGSHSACILLFACTQVCSLIRALCVVQVGSLHHVGVVIMLLLAVAPLPIIFNPWMDPPDDTLRVGLAAAAMAPTKSAQASCRQAPPQRTLKSAGSKVASLIRGANAFRERASEATADRSSPSPSALVLETPVAYTLSQVA